MALGTSRKVRLGQIHNLGWNSPNHPLRVLVSSQVGFKYPHVIAEIFELCPVTAVFVRRHEVAALVQREDSEVTEERAAPISHFFVIFLADQQRPRESMEEVKSFRRIWERKRFKERPSGLLLYGGERNVVG